MNNMPNSPTTDQNSDSSEDPVSNPELLVSPILLLLRRMERYENVIERLRQRGVVTDEDLQIADLTATLSHAERIIKVRERTGRPAKEIMEAADTVRQALRDIA
jgi:hypothetical protein